MNTKHHIHREKGSVAKDKDKDNDKDNDKDKDDKDGKEKWTQNIIFTARRVVLQNTGWIVAAEALVEERGWK